MKNPESAADYPLISLCNVLYNIVEKILSVRIKPYLDNFISWSQNAFMPGRQILDNIIAAKELLHSMNASYAENGHFALKVDMAKAYDRVNWVFLGDMLQLMGIQDDLFFFGERSRVNINNLKKILEEYASLSGQKINYNKSSIHFSRGIADIRKQTSIMDLGVKEMSEEEKYLGIYPLKSDYRIGSYDFLKDKFNSRYSGWGQHCTNHAGRTVLCKSTLTAIPVYFMEICLLPKGVTDYIDKVIRSFWWGHTADERKMHFFKWEKPELLKEFGGLGIRNS
ncbi:uncharacterized protein LOC113322317 [Papaver somniferum]|uniref:uncharacterized protein LOC113322317 n=1 Tax=Papaver somniferum TaxID=3469 RepID=UPI000E6FAC12|nr:uncharacterized protein LOC113322317 [Papaver somniferum]